MEVYFYNIVFTGAAALAFVLAIITRRAALRLGVVDKPDSDRKLHQSPVPLLGGIAVFAAFFAVAFIARKQLLAGDLEAHHWIGVFSGALILVFGGIADDKYDLKPRMQFIFPLLAAVAVVAGGVGIEKVTNPFGGLMFLDSLRFPVLFFGGAWHYFVLVADTFTIVWLLGMMYTTKLLDGLDGLVSGMTAIGGIIIFLFTMTTRYYQPDIGLAALILSGACLGFLILNWHPAKIFLGESGSLVCGFLLGVLAIISGGKIAIALLVMGIPILDVAWTIVRRLAAGKHPFKISDRLHLHQRLHDLGLGHKKTVLIYYAFSSIFGLSALFLQSRGKLYALAAILAVMIAVVVGFSLWDGRKAGGSSNR